LKHAETLHAQAHALRQWAAAIGETPRSYHQRHPEQWTMKEFALFVIRHLVNDPAAVEVKETRGDTASVIELKVAKEDLGRVIGKAGHTVAALRTILHAVASRMQRRVVLQIVEKEEK
jgi:predicted RNA-binding protein YlqC (UPF0109 family)